MQFVLEFLLAIFILNFGGMYSESAKIDFSRIAFGKAVDEVSSGVSQSESSEIYVHNILELLCFKERQWRSYLGS